MKNKIIISITIIVLFSATFGISIPSAIAQGYALFNLESKKVNNNITIDGIYDTEEWGEVDMESFTLYGHNNPTTNQRVIEVASVYNDTTLFLWVTLDEPDTEYGTFILIFQSTNEPIVINHSIPTFSEGNDAKVIYSDNLTWDGVIGSSSGANSDVSEGGTNDSDAKCVTRSGGFDFEMAITLNSGDTNGGDVSLLPGDSINMFPSYVNFAENGEYALIHTVDDWWEQILVKLAEPSIPSYSIPILLFSMLAVCTILIFKNKQQF